MEPWKIGVILALIVSLGGYKYYEANMPPAPPEPAQQDPQATELQTKFKQMVGQPAPTWNIESKLWLNAPKPIGLNDLKGSVTLIEFWRAACSHCREAAPFMQQQVYEKFKPHGLKMVTFHSPGRGNDPGETFAGVQGAIRELGIKYPVAYDTNARLFREKYNGTSFPSIFILDKDGVIRYVQDGHTPEKEIVLLKTLHEMLDVKMPSTLATAAAAPPKTTVNAPAGAPAGIPAGAPAADPHAGHNHPPGMGHGEAPAEGHEGHNHPPGVEHGEAPTGEAPTGEAPTGHEGHNHPPGVTH